MPGAYIPVRLGHGVDRGRILSDLILHYLIVSYVVLSDLMLSYLILS